MANIYTDGSSYNQLSKYINYYNGPTNGIPAWYNYLTTNKDVLDDYYNYTLLNPNDISLPKWMWRFKKLHNDGKDMFHFKVSLEHPDEAGNTNTAEVYFNEPRWDVDSSGSFSGNPIYDDEYRAFNFLHQRRTLSTDNPSDSDQWWWNLVIKINGVDVSGSTQFTLNNPKGSAYGFVTFNMPSSILRPPCSSLFTVYNLGSDNNYSSLAGKVFGEIVEYNFDIQYATPTTVVNGTQTRQFYRTTKYVTIGGWASDSIVPNANWSTGTTISIENLNMGGITFKKKEISKNWDNNDFDGGAGTNYTYGGDLEDFTSGDILESTFVADDLNPIFYATW